MTAEKTAGAVAPEGGAMDDGIETRVSLAEDAIKNHEQRITEHGREIDELRLARAADQVTLKNINETVQEIHSELKAEAAKPGMKLDAIMSTVTNCIITAVLIYMLAQIGIH